MKLFQDDKGHPSAMRAVVLPAAWVAIAGVVAGYVGVFLGYETAGLAGICAGIITVCVGAKWAQKREEVKGER